MRTCLTAAIVCALGASFAERIPSDGSAPSGDVGVAPSAAVDSAAWITLPGCADSAPAYAKFRVAFAATDDPLEFDVTADERDRVMEIVKQEMESVCTLSVPLITECNYGKNWREAH